MESSEAVARGEELSPFAHSLTHSSAEYTLLTGLSGNSRIFTFTNAPFVTLGPAQIQLEDHEVLCARDDWAEHSGCPTDLLQAGAWGLGWGQEAGGCGYREAPTAPPNNDPLPQAVRWVCSLGWAPPSFLLALPLFCRRSCTSGQMVSLRCSGESCPGSGKEAVGGGRLPRALRVGHPHWEAQLGLGWGSLPTCLQGPFLQTEFCPNRAPSTPLSHSPPATGLGG